MAHEFDVGFEKYVIFHRGISSINITPIDQGGDGHLHIIYQDGTDQDLGDPWGGSAVTVYNQAVQAQTDASSAAAQATSALNEIRTLTENLNESVAKAEEFQENIDNLKDEQSEAIQGVHEYIIDQIESVDCIDSETDSQTNEKVFFVTYNPATNAEIDAIFA